MKPEHSRAFSVASFSDREPTISSTALDRWALGRIQAFVPKARLRLALWDGFSLVPRTGPAVGTITVKNRRTLWSWIRDPELNFGESYMSGSAEVHGDLVSVLAEVYRALPRAAHTPAGPPGGPRRRRGGRRSRLPRHPRRLGCVRLGRHARARRAAQLRRAGGGDPSRDFSRGTWPAPLHRPEPTLFVECVDSQAYLPRGLSAGTSRGVRTGVGAAQLLGPRRREPAAAL